MNPKQDKTNTNNCPISNYRPIWNGLDNLRDDLCAQNIAEYQSQQPGCYRTDNFFRWCETQDQYATLMTEPAQFYKPYRNACKVDVESVLRNSELTNMGEIYRLYTRPYMGGPYIGPGANSLDNSNQLFGTTSVNTQNSSMDRLQSVIQSGGADVNSTNATNDTSNFNSIETPNDGITGNNQSMKALESQLQQGYFTLNRQACNPTSGVTINRFSCLPVFGNPQRVENIVPPWVNGGENTRDYVRRVNYEKMCLNRQNNNIINRTQ